MPVISLENWKWRKPVRKFLVLLAVCLLAGASLAEDSRLLDSMDDVSQWRSKADDERIALSSDPLAHEGSAGIRVDITKGIFVLALKTFTPDPGWNDFDGLAFWLKGDGSQNWGCIRLQAGNYNKGYVGTFPLRDTNWHEVKLAWQDFVPFRHDLPELGTRDGLTPGDINLIGWGNSWNFTTKHKVPAITFSVDEVRLVRGIEPDRPRVSIDAFPPVSGVLARLKAGRPVTILALGDSITWGTSAGGNANAYPARLGRMLAEQYGNEQVAVVSRAIGGSTTAKGRQWLKRDVAGVEADLITVMFGFNEAPSKDDPQASARTFRANLIKYVEEVAGQMKKPPACIFIATVPGRDKAWERLDVYAEAVREIGREHPNVSVADANAYFKQLGKEAYAALMADEAHPNKVGQERIATVLLQTIAGEGQRE